MKGIRVDSSLSEREAFARQSKIQAGTHKAAGRIFVDGMNLSLERGTGVSTYSRTLTQAASRLGYEVGVVYNSRHGLSRKTQIREIEFFDYSSPRHLNWGDILPQLVDHIQCWFGRRPERINLSDLVDIRQFEARLPTYDLLYAVRNLFSSAAAYFHLTDRFAELLFDQPPDIFHWTYPMPLRGGKTRNIYTIHDLVPLRLPFATLDDKRHIYRLLRAVADRADHIVTVSEHSKRDIIRFLGVPEHRVTNTFQAVEFPLAGETRSENELALQLERSYGLELNKYLLFYGAMEPKKNLHRLIEAYLASGADMPLLLIASGGWGNEAEMSLIKNHERLPRSFDGQLSTGRGKPRLARGIVHLDYVSRRILAILIQGARAVLFPSLYEGFGLPVLEAMRLGTAVVTSQESSLPEIAGDAALLVDPYKISSIAEAIRTIASDAELAAELARLGRIRAEMFSIDAYQARLGALYASLQ